MKKGLYIIFFLCMVLSNVVHAQKNDTQQTGYKFPVTYHNGDTLLTITLRSVYVYPKMVFKNKRQERYYYRLVRNVKKTLPIAKEVRLAVIETYEYLETLPDEKSRKKHIKAVEKGLKEQYYPRMKKLTFSQGKLLIKLINRECNQSSYELTKAFLGPFKAGFYQAFAALFGASLKKEYHPEKEDAIIERIIILVENGQL